MTQQQYTKTALKFSDQVVLLKKRGLAIPDEKAAEEMLSRLSYYRLSAYFHPFKQLPGDTFHPGSSFDEAVRLYEFDRRLRLHVLDAIERFEVHFRTAITYELAHAFGPFGHEKASNFRGGFNHVGWLVKLQDEVLRSKETFVDHYKTKYQGFPALPIWMATELMSFGTLSKLFGQGLLSPERAAVANWFSLNHDVLKSWAHVVSIIRNFCAHHSRLWNRQHGVTPLVVKGAPEWSTVHVPSRSHVYFVLLVLRYLTRGQQGAADWTARTVTLLSEMDLFPHWQSVMGMPPTWKTHPFWQP